MKAHGTRLRIPPIEPPYTSQVQTALDKVTRGTPPLLLFRTIAHNPRVLERLVAGGLLDPGSIALRTRELMILRTCALCGAQYEWGVHVAVFGAKAEWTAEQVHSTVRGGAEDACWSNEERLVIRLADQLHSTSDVSEDLWDDASSSLLPEQLIELIMLAGLYHAVSFVVNALGVENESAAPTFPTIA